MQARSAQYERQRAEYLLDRIAELGGPAISGGAVASARLRVDLEDGEAGPVRVETHTYFDANGSELGAAVWRAREVNGLWEAAQ